MFDQPLIVSSENKHADVARGNRKNFFFQPNLPTHETDRLHQQSAQRTANQTMHSVNSFIQPKVVQRKCAHCEQEEKKIQRKKIDTERTTGDGVENYIEKLSGSGLPMPEEVRNFYEPRFGYDFSGVKLHTDTVAAKSAQSVNAVAYTSGNNIVFNSGAYSPNTDNGKRLLAHELTHIVQQTDNAPASMVQRQAKPKKNYPFSLTFSGCDVTPWNKVAIERAAKVAFETVRDTKCIKTESLKEDILAEFDGLNIDCEQGKDEPCGRASRYFTHTVNIYPTAFDPGCPSLAALILHEVTHLTEWALLGEGDLAIGCEESCFPGSGWGDPSKCTAETGFLPVTGVSGGLAFPRKGSSALYGRLYLGIEKRGPVLSFIHPSLGIGVGLIGESTTGEPGAVSSGPTTLISLLGGIRLDPGETGGGYISFSGGPALAIGGGQKGIGVEAGTALGYRWRWLDVSLDAGYTYDPTREAGMDKFFTLGASIRIGPQIRE